MNDDDTIILEIPAPEGWEFDCSTDTVVLDIPAEVMP